MSTSWLIFGILQACSLAILFAISWMYLRHQNDRKHIFALLGHGSFSKHMTMGHILLGIYIALTLFIAGGSAFVLFILSNGNL